uniref:Uncharacterized protein n=1 Tax=Anopheles merus TaxID=30066 RepID=A0A182UQX8_ANOME
MTVRTRNKEVSPALTIMADRTAGKGRTAGMMHWSVAVVWGVLQITSRWSRGFVGPLLSTDIRCRLSAISSEWTELFRSRRSAAAAAARFSSWLTIGAPPPLLLPPPTPPLFGEELLCRLDRWGGGEAPCDTYSESSSIFSG